MTTITRSQVVEKLRAIAEDNPDNIAECNYVDNETLEPMCIVGHYLVGLGVPAEFLLENNGLSYGALSSRRYSGDTIPTHTDEAYNLLVMTQSNQDAGHPWSFAFESAERGVWLNSALEYEDNENS